MLANLARNKFRYLLGAILIIVLALVISAYRSGEIDRMFNEGRQASSAVIYGRRDDDGRSLQAFINETRAQRGKKISATQADILIAFAQNVIAGLQ